MNAFLSKFEPQNFSIASFSTYLKNSIEKLVEELEALLIGKSDFKKPIGWEKFGISGSS